MSEKDFTRQIYLRKGDFLKPEARKVNIMMQALSNSIALIKKENLLLLEDIEESRQASGSLSEIDEKLKGLRERANRCRLELDDFQLIGDRTVTSASSQGPQLVGESTFSANKCT